MLHIYLYLYIRRIYIYIVYFPLDALVQVAHVDSAAHQIATSAATRDAGRLPEECTFQHTTTELFKAEREALKQSIRR